jgi:tetratricopeptide (TPR) repeat protein
MERAVSPRGVRILTRRAAALLSTIVVSLSAAAGAQGSADPAGSSSRPSAKPPPAATDPVARLLDEGWRQLGMVNYAKAQRIFEDVQKRKPSRAQQAEALFALGHLWQYRRPGADVSEARKLYRRVADQLKDTPAAPLALLALARLADAPEYEKDRDRDRARALYRRAAATYPGHFTAHEAVLRLTMTYLEEVGSRQAEDEGAAILSKHLAEHPRNLLAPIMHGQLADLHQRRKEYAKAVEHWVTSDEIDERAGAAASKAVGRGRRTDEFRAMSRQARATLYYKIAKVSEKYLKDYATAAVWYRRIVDDIRHDNKYYAAKIAAERCRKLAGRAGARPATRPAGGKGDRP